MNKETSSSSTIRIGSGTGAATALTITFVILKALGYIDWSWWWVFSPLWISAIMVVGFLVIAGLILLLAAFKGYV